MKIEIGLAQIDINIHYVNHVTIEKNKVRHPPLERGFYKIAMSCSTSQYIFLKFIRSDFEESRELLMESRLN